MNHDEITTRLITQGLLQDQTRRKKTKQRWYMIILAIVLFILTRYMMLKTQYSQVFNLFKSDNIAEKYSCDSKERNPWNIVLSMAYPTLSKWANTLTLYQSPLSQDQATFLWEAIYTGMIPTQEQINQDPLSSALQLTPLGYLCGNILQIWNDYLKQVDPEHANKTAQDVINDPAHSPFHWFLTTKSTLLGNTESVQELITKGLWGLVVWAGKHSSPKDLYEYLYGQKPPPPKCSEVDRVSGILSNAAIFAMAGSTFTKPGGSYNGAIIAGGVALGVGLGLLGKQGNCKPVISIPGLS